MPRRRFSTGLLSRSSCVVVRNALRHLYTDTLGQPDYLAALPRPKRQRRLPVVLSREEVQRLFATVTNLKQKALFMVAYDAGLRLVGTAQPPRRRHR